MSTKMLNIFILTVIFTAAAVQARPMFYELSTATELSFKNESTIMREICTPKNCLNGPIDASDLCWKDARVTDKSICTRACVDRFEGVLCFCTNNTVSDFGANCTVLEGPRKQILARFAEGQCLAILLISTRFVIALLCAFVVLYKFKNVNPVVLCARKIKKCLHSHRSRNRNRHLYDGDNVLIWPDDIGTEVETVRYVETRRRVPGDRDITSVLPRPKILLSRRDIAIKKSKRYDSIRGWKLAQTIPEPLQEQELRTLPGFVEINIGDKTMVMVDVPRSMFARFSIKSDAENIFLVYLKKNFISTTNAKPTEANLTTDTAKLAQVKPNKVVANNFGPNKIVPTENKTEGRPFRIMLETTANKMKAIEDDDTAELMQSEFEPAQEFEKTEELEQTEEFEENEEFGKNKGQ